MHPDELVLFQGTMSPVIDAALKEAKGRAVFVRFGGSAGETTQRPLDAEEFMSCFPAIV